MEFVLARNSCGKKQAIFEKIKKIIKEDEHREVLMIVPEQSTFRMERDIINSLELKGLFNIQVLSFDRLIHVLLDKHGGASIEPIDFIGKSMIARSVLDSNKDKLGVFSKSVSKPGFEVKLAELFSELKRQDLSLDNLNDALKMDIDEVTKKKLSDISILFESYLSHLEQKKLDSEDVNNIAINKAKDSEFIKNSHIFIYGFDLLTAQLLRLLVYIIKNAISTTICFTMNGEHDRDKKVFAPEVKMYNMITKAISSFEPNPKITYIGYDKEKDDISKEIRHIEKNLFAYPYEPYSDDVNDIIVDIYESKNKEVMGLCHKIIGYIDAGYRFRDIGVCISDTNEYDMIISEVFKKNSIPYFMDVKRKMINTSFAEFIVSLLDFVLYKDISEFLIHIKCGFIKTNIDKLYEFENHVRMFDIKGYMLKYSFRNDLEDYRQSIVDPVNSLVEDIKNSSKAEQYSDCILRYFENLDVEKNIEQYVLRLEEQGDNENALIYLQVYNKIIEIINQCKVSFKADNISFASFVSAIKAGIEAAEIAIIPPSTDEVLIGDFSRTVFPKVKVMFVLGLNDGKIPTKPDDSTILTEAEKLTLQNNGINAGYRDRFFEERFRIYSVFTRSCDKLNLSYFSKSRDDKPSVILKRLEKIFPKLAVNDKCGYSEVYKEFDEELLFLEMCLSIKQGLNVNEQVLKWRDIYEYFKNDNQYTARIQSFEDRIFGLQSEKHIKNAFELYSKNNVMPASVSRVESFYRCPFKFFMDYGIRPYDNAMFEESSMDMGNFLHQCLHLFTTKLSEEKIRWADIDDDTIAAYCDEIIMAVIEYHNDGIFKKSNRFKYVLERLKLEFVFAVKVVRSQLSDTFVDVYKSEMKLKDKNYLDIVLDNDVVVSLTCNIDRVDVCKDDGNTFVRIVDYKSSAKTVDYKELYYGINIQLPIYLKAIKEYFKSIGVNAVNGGAFYLDLGLLEVEDNSEKNLLKLKEMNGFINENVTVNKVMSAMEGNSFIAIKGFVKKDGSLSTAVKTIFTDEEFESLFSHCENRIKQAMGSILDGNVSVSPFNNAGKTPCDYCEYNSICLFDRINGQYRAYMPKSKEDILHV